MRVFVFGILDGQRRLVQELIRRRVIDESVDQVDFVESADPAQDTLSIEVMITGLIESGQERIRDVFQEAIRRRNVLGSRIIVNFVEKAESVSSMFGDFRLTARFPKSALDPSAH